MRIHVNVQMGFDAYYDVPDDVADDPERLKRWCERQADRTSEALEAACDPIVELCTTTVLEVEDDETGITICSKQ